MARLARVIAPGMPHLLTQRGNRRQETFFSDDDYRAYKDLIAAWCGRHGVQVWAYCLMPNHVNLIVVPPAEDALRRAIGEAHRRYSRRVNLRENWRGHLWQGRFASFPLDEAHLLNAARYVEQNPVRARLCRKPWRWPWSSAKAHVEGRDDGLVTVAPLEARVGDWREFLADRLEEEELDTLRRHERTGRPLGDDAFLDRLEAELDRTLRPRKRGPKPRKQGG